MKFYLTAALAFAACVASFAVSASAQDVEHPKQAMCAVPFTNVQLDDWFWAPRIEANRVVSVPHNIKWCETETGRIDNFKIAGGLEKGKFKGIFFDDSDVYKILEGFAYSLAAHPDPELEKKADEWIDYIGKAQEDDGYLMCYFTLVKPAEKWTNLANMHELYCAGHMAEAAVAYKRATGKDSFLNINRKLLDLICKRYGSNEGQLKNVPGHEEIELALVKMYQLTGDRKYLDEAKFFIDVRGVAEGREKGLYGEYCQDHMPVREQSEIVGHAVRAMYLYAGATDVAGYYKDEKLMDAMRRIYTNLTRNKTYITGGIGSSRHNEGFEENFKLPNAEAYCETCASIGMVLWTHRLNLATGEAQFADAMERSAYNGFMSGYSLNGDKYFYVNPLESKGNHHRQPFFGCACCPSNVIRVLPSIPGYFYAVAESADKGADTIVVNMYGTGTANIELADKFVKVDQATSYPFDGAVAIRTTVTMKDENAAPTPFVLKTRVPAWSGLESDPDGYVCQAIDPSKDPVAIIGLNFPMDVVRMIANPNVKADLNRVALQRGPIVYCFEEVDNPGVRVDRIILAKDPQFKVETRKNFISSKDDNEATKNAKSRTVNVITCKDYMGRDLVAVPYCVWDNRAPGRMNVWVYQQGLDMSEGSPVASEEWTDAQGAPILYKALDVSKLTDDVPDLALMTAFDGSFTADGHSSLDATNQGAPANSADQSVPRATWWDRKGTEEWFSYEFPKAKTISKVSVYWFDDEAINGGCRVPESWSLSYFNEDTEEWVPLETKEGYEVKKDAAIDVTFTPVATSKIRLNAKLQKGFSGGILRWSVD